MKTRLLREVIFAKHDKGFHIRIWSLGGIKGKGSPSALNGFTYLNNSSQLTIYYNSKI